MKAKKITGTTKTKRTAVARGRVMPKRTFPAHLSMDTPEEWRSLKRTQWREVMQALDRYNYGSAYTPSQSPLHDLQRLARQVTEAIEAEGWIAW